MIPVSAVDWREPFRAWVLNTHSPTAGLNYREDESKKLRWRFVTSVVGLHDAFGWCLETVMVQVLDYVYAQRVFSDWHRIATRDVNLLDISYLAFDQSLADIKVVC